MAFNVMSLMRNVCNTKDMSLVNDHRLTDVGIGKYMFSRWLSMTSLRNALLASEMFNSYYAPTDLNLLYMEASRFSIPYKSFRYIKKPKSTKTNRIEREFPSSISTREKELYSNTLDYLEELEKSCNE